MGIHDREYYQTTNRGQGPLGRITSTAVGTLILINVVVWFIQFFTEPKRGLGPGPVTALLGASPSDVFGSFQVWRVLTANFAHDPNDMMHVLWNMLFLFFFGRDLERIYGKKDFYLLYLGSGTLAVLAELIVLGSSGNEITLVYGASGAVMAVLMLFTLFYPTRTILLFLVIPVPVWILCLMCVFVDLSGAFARSKDGVANFAHLTGFLVGFLFRYYDLRCVRLQGYWRALFGTRRTRRRAPRGSQSKVIPFPREERHDEIAGEIAAISERIDALLEKISSDGRDSLTEEELDFLKENSGKYRSPKT